MEKEFIITIFSENTVGLLSQITTVFTQRNINIESITASESAIKGIYKHTIMVKNDPEKVANLVKQIEKKVDVLKAFCYSPSEVVLQELALYKVQRSRNVEELETAVRKLQSNCVGASRAGANGARAKLEFALKSAKQGTTVIIGHARHRLSDLVSGRVACTRIGVE